MPVPPANSVAAAPAGRLTIVLQDKSGTSMQRSARRSGGPITLTGLAAMQSSGAGSSVGKEGGEMDGTPLGSAPLPLLRWPVLSGHTTSPKAPLSSAGSSALSGPQPSPGQGSTTPAATGTGQHSEAFRADAAASLPDAEDDTCLVSLQLGRKGSEGTMSFSSSWHDTSWDAASDNAEACRHEAPGETLVCSPAMLAGQGTNLTGVPSLHSHKPSFPASALGMSSLLDPHVASGAQVSMASDSLDSAVVQSRAQCFGSGGDTGSVIRLEPGGHLQPLGMVGLHSPAPAHTLAPLHATSPSAALAPPSTLSPKAGIAMRVPTSTSFSGGAPAEAAEVGRETTGQGGKTHLPPPSPQSRAVKLAAQPGAARFK
ncbi:unnamed protein product [Symbiodinium sp. KB8]|nr:unnamed protein product [Symbiodinium sp. KB8]